MLRTRDLYRINSCNNMDFLTKLSFHAGTLSAYISHFLVYLNVRLYIVTMLLAALSNVATSSTHATTMLSGIAYPWLVSYGITNGLPLFAEKGPSWLFTMKTSRFFFAGMWFFGFHHNAQADAFKNSALTGRAEYKGTGRPPPYEHKTMMDNYEYYASSHFHPALMLLVVTLLHAELVGPDAATLNMALVSAVWIFTPSLFTPHIWKSSPKAFVGHITGYPAFDGLMASDDYSWTNTDGDFKINGHRQPFYSFWRCHEQTRWCSEMQQLHLPFGHITAYVLLALALLLVSPVACRQIAWRYIAGWVLFAALSFFQHWHESGHSHHVGTAYPIRRRFLIGFLWQVTPLMLLVAELWVHRSEESGSEGVGTALTRRLFALAFVMPVSRAVYLILLELVRYKVYFLEKGSMPVYEGYRLWPIPPKGENSEQRTRRRQAEKKARDIAWYLDAAYRMCLQHHLVQIMALMLCAVQTLGLIIIWTSDVLSAGGHSWFLFGYWNVYNKVRSALKAGMEDKQKIMRAMQREEQPTENQGDQPESQRHDEARETINRMVNFMTALQASPEVMSAVLHSPTCRNTLASLSPSPPGSPQHLNSTGSPRFHRELFGGNSATAFERPQRVDRLQHVQAVGRHSTEMRPLQSAEVAGEDMRSRPYLPNESPTQYQRNRAGEDVSHARRRRQTSGNAHRL